MIDPAVFISLLKGEFSSCSFSYNDHACNYETVEKYLERDGREMEFVSPAEKQKAVATNSLWEFQWYPNTPIGFYRIAASSLEAIEEWLKAKG